MTYSHTKPRFLLSVDVIVHKGIESTLAMLKRVLLVLGGPLYCTDQYEGEGIPVVID